MGTRRPGFTTSRRKSDTPVRSASSTRTSTSMRLSASRKRVTTLPCTFSRTSDATDRTFKLYFAKTSRLYTICTSGLPRWRLDFTS